MLGTQRLASSERGTGTEDVAPMCAGRGELRWSESWLRLRAHREFDIAARLPRQDAGRDVRG